MWMEAQMQGLSPFAGMNIGTWLSGLAAREGDRPLLVWEPAEGPVRRWSYRQFVEDVARIGAGMRARGVRRGDRVLVHLENCPETLLARFACAWIGAVCVGTNAMAVGPELRHFATSSGAVGAITQPKSAAIVAAHCPGLRWLVVTSDDAGVPAVAGTRPEAAARFETLLGDAIPPEMVAPDETASLMFTTGTTSLPKAVVWTHANVLWGARLNAMQQRLRADDVALLFLPLFHVVGLSWCFTSMLWAGGCTVLQPRFSASGFWPAALRHRATVGSQVFATMKLLHQQEVPAHGFRRWICARHEPVEMAHFGVDFVSGWGMTEVLTQAIVCEPGWTAPDGAIGRPSVGYRVRIVDDAGQDVRPGESGALLVGGVRGLSLFKEYDANPAANAEAFDAHGFFRTGDRVVLREDGWIVFGDRIKDVIKVGGEGVSAGEIEAVLGRADGVADVAVVAAPHEVYGEVPVAFVVLRDADEGRQAACAAWMEAECQSQLSAFKRPRHIAFVAALPRVGFGKISKVRLREMAREIDLAEPARKL